MPRGFRLLGILYEKEYSTQMTLTYLDFTSVLYLFTEFEPDSKSDKVDLTLTLDDLQFKKETNKQKLQQTTHTTQHNTTQDKTTQHNTTNTKTDKHTFCASSEAFGK